MQQDNPILVVDNDSDDLEMIKEAAECLKIPNQILIFNSGEELRDYLKSSPVSPFLILCDVNVSKSGGFELRKMLMADDTVKYKSVPFIFWSNHASEKQIQYAYDLPAQGFFLKSDNFPSLCETLTNIVAYWKHSQHPKLL